MAKVVEKIIYMSKADIVRYQLSTHCFIERIKLSDCDLDCLTLLGQMGEKELAEFCSMAEISDELVRHEQWYKDDYKSVGKKKGLFGSAQTVRNFLTRQEKNGLVSKIGTSRKKIKLNPALSVVAEGTVVLNYKIAYIEPKES
jgi:hypothetical protein